MSFDMPMRLHTEADRMAALARYDILDTSRERELDDIVRIAAQICGVSAAMISLIDDKRQWFKATAGMDLEETPREIAFCAMAIDQANTLVVEDASQDPRFAANPLVTGDRHLRFYAGAQLLTPEGVALGTLCVIDQKPHRLSADQQLSLEALARQVMTHFELRRLLANKDAAERGLRESETRGRLALEAAELGTWEAIAGTSQLFSDARTRVILGDDADERMSFDTFLARVHPEDSERFAAAVAVAIGEASDGRLDIEYRVRSRGVDEHRWLRSRAQVIKNPGERHRLVGTVRDISAEKAADEHRKLLNGELQHRVKNTLGVVQGIVSQSLRAVATPAEASIAISNRLVTLAHAHDVLTQTSWTAAPLIAVIQGAVHVHLSEPSRIVVSGPPIEMKARAALALSMALHELFTNAVKYGALSNSSGTVAFTWTIAREGAGSTVEFEWRERGGPRVDPPTRKGFGSRLTGSSLAGDLGGSGVADYAADGLRWTLSTTLAAITDPVLSLVGKGT